MIEKIYDAVLEFEIDEITSYVEEAINEGVDAKAILNEGLISALDEIGRLFSEGEIFVPEMLMAAHTMKAGMEIIKPKLKGQGEESRGTLIIGSVKGDLHDIGKNLVVMMLEGGGFNVIDLGIDVDKEDFIKAAIENNADIVGLSALLTTTMPALDEAIQAIKESGISVKTMVGGAPVTQEFADKIGADGYSEDASGAVILARRLIKEKQVTA
ncbi:MAG: cobalamin B12-binding domain-containing protein [Peptostreptococcaceae bacterium]